MADRQRSRSQVPSTTPCHDRHDLGGVISVHHEVVLLIPVKSVVSPKPESEELLQVAADIRKLSHLVTGALKVAVINRIEANQGDKADIGLVMWSPTTGAACLSDLHPVSAST